MSTVSLNLFLRELNRESVPLQVVNKLAWGRDTFKDLVWCIPLIFGGMKNMARLYNCEWSKPTYLLINQENLREFQGFDERMPEEYRGRLINNLHAINAMREQLKGASETYYCTIPRHTVGSTLAAEATATGQIIIYDEICTSTPLAAKGIFAHEWTHVQRKDGYLGWSLKMAAAVARVFTLYVSPWSLLLISPLLTYGNMKFSHYCEYRADRTAVSVVADPSDFINELRDSAKQLSEQIIWYIEKNNPSSYCNRANYAQLNEEEKWLVAIRVSNLGINSLTSPTFSHPSYVERVQYLEGCV